MASPAAPTHAPLHDAIALRPATPDDALCMAVLAMQVFLDTYATHGIRPEIAREVLGSHTPEACRALLQRRDVAVLVAERHGHLLGFSQCTLGTGHPLVQTAAPAELDRLYVQEPFTGRGLGRRLLHAAEADAAARGATLLWLACWVRNDRARHFYAREGYADIGATWFALEGERHENRVLVMPLPRAASARSTDTPHPASPEPP